LGNSHNGVDHRFGHSEAPVEEETIEDIKMKEILDLLRDVVINPILNRKKDQLAFIETQLKDGTDLDPQTYKRLKSVKEKLLLEIGAHTTGSSELIRQMLAISEYIVEGGVEWRILNHARPHLAPGKQGRPKVVIKKTEWVEAILGGVVAVIFSCLFVFSALYSKLSLPSNLKAGLSYLALSFICAGLAILFGTPIGKITAAKKVDRYLKLEKQLSRFVNEVIRQIPALKQAYEEHRQTYGEVIPYVIMDEFSNYVIEDLRSHKDSEVFHKFVKTLENRTGAEDEVSTMIRTSFCETVDSRWGDKELHGRLMENLSGSMKKWLTVR
jgi:hypothetical protein